ncbi:MAG: helix-turn-helix domain-containing protein [Selenomonadaceae bacterium]|nr:helix-turn-helix domain-containing protein [Selenomonadaceae bacterium]
MKHAFAFRDFDRARILTRPFFKSFGFTPEKRDTEILQSLKAADSDSVDDMEEKLKTIERLQDKLVDFQHFIGRHQERLNRLKYSERNNDSVVVGYLQAVFDCVGLMKKINLLYDTVEKQTQERYRRDFAARLKKARTATGLTQRQLADMVNISPTGFASYEQAKSDPSIPTLIRLAKILKLSENQILGLT